MTRIEEIKEEIRLTRELIDLRKQLEKTHTVVNVVNVQPKDSDEDYAKTLSDWLTKNKVPKYTPKDKDYSMDIKVGGFKTTGTGEMKFATGGIVYSSQPVATDLGWENSKKAWEGIELPSYREGACAYSD